MINIMIDIETLGTKPGCTILSIAAVPFAYASTEDYEPFYQKISETSCASYGLCSDIDTVNWWGRQSAEARTEAFSGTRDLKEVLEEFTAYLQQWQGCKVWGNGASFDVPLLEAAYSACDMQPPWKYFNSMCYRTLKTLYPQIPFVPARIKHNALHDAIAQASHAERIFRFARIGDR